MMCGPGRSDGSRSQDTASCPRARKASRTTPENSQATRTRMTDHASDRLARTLRGLGLRLRLCAQPFRLHRGEAAAFAIEDRLAPRLGLPAFDGHIDIGGADLHREDAPAVGLARHDLRARAGERLVAEPAPRHMLAHRDAEGVERLRRRMVGPVVLGEARQRPCRGQRFVGHLRRAVRAAPAHEAGLVFPEVMRPGENPAVLHPDDLLMHEGARPSPSRPPASPGGARRASSTRRHPR